MTKSTGIHLCKGLLLAVAVFMPLVILYRGYLDYSHAQMGAGDVSEKFSDMIINTVVVLPTSGVCAVLGLGLSRWLHDLSAKDLPWAKRLTPIWIIILGACVTIVVVVLCICTGL